MTETLPNGLVRMPAQGLRAPDIDTLVAGALSHKCNTEKPYERQLVSNISLIQRFSELWGYELWVPIFQKGARELQRVSEPAAKLRKVQEV